MNGRKLEEYHTHHITPYVLEINSVSTSPKFNQGAAAYFRGADG